MRSIHNMLTALLSRGYLDTPFTRGGFRPNTRLAGNRSQPQEVQKLLIAKAAEKRARRLARNIRNEKARKWGKIEGFGALYS